MPDAACTWRVSDCTLHELATITDPRGNLSFVEGEVHVPFPIRRVYYLYDVPEGGDRGGHAHRALRQLMIAVRGAVDVVLDDGEQSRTVRLDRPTIGLEVCPMMWRELRHFAPGTVCVVLASERYDEGDYFRTYDAFVAARRDA